VDSSGCPSNRTDPFMTASSMKIFAHIVKFVCVLLFYEPAAKWPAIEKASNLMASMGKLMRLGL